MQTVYRDGFKKFIQPLGALVIAAVVLISYYPALSVGFWYDDYNLLQIVGRPTTQDFLVQTFDPRVSHIEYRPAREIQWRIEYMLWGNNALPYHIVQNMLHLLVCLLIYGLLSRFRRNWRAGLVGALVYSVLPTYGLAVFWLAVADPLMLFFYLLTIWLWVDYLEKGTRWRFLFTLAAFVAAFFSKELAVSLPLTLLLVDRWLVAKPARWSEWAKRNAPFFLFLPIWVLLLWNELGLFSRYASVQADWNRFFLNLIYYLGKLSFPWSDDSPVKYLIMIAVLILLIRAVVLRHRALLFLGAVGFLTLLPNMNFQGTSTRHLYLSLTVTAAGIGLGTVWLWRRLSASAFVLPRISALRIVFALGLCALIMWQSSITADSATNVASQARLERLSFRSIFQRHASFEPGTLLYFVEPPIVDYNVSGLMFLRYGSNVRVEANEGSERADLRQSSRAYVFYPDEQNTLQERYVDRAAIAQINYPLPVQFDQDIVLDGFEVVNTQAQKGEAIVVLLYWRATRKIDKDYTVFAHLMDGNGNLLTSYDSQPRHGIAPTTAWKPNAQIVDAIILPINSDTPVGQNYRIAVGLYDLSTLKRLPILEGGNSTDKNEIIFDSFAVTP